MSHRPADESLPIELRRAIDECCDRYEQAWLAGETPRFVDFVREIPDGVKQEALRELIAIEMEYARDERGHRLKIDNVVDRHPEFALELTKLLAKLPKPREFVDGPRADHSSKVTVATIRPSGSRGLHIRCPHCQVALELLADAPLDEINCSGCGSNFSLVDWEENDAERSPLKQIGRFHLMGRIGMGGFGTVWKARDPDLDRSVAIKIPRKGQLSGAESELFFREARAAAQLKHPNIVPVHEVGRDGDTIFIVSELILGESLANWLKEQHPTLREMTELLAKVADALHYAHECGVVHRDFKPSNVMIDQLGEPHLMDFGLAKREAGEVTMTIDGQVVGTPAYMSPEQAAGGTHWVDRRTDVYSLGVVLFEVLTGELPFRGNAQMQIRERLSADAPSPRRLNQRAPIDLSTICLKCLEREPNRRYSTAREVGEELRRYLRGEPIAARPISAVGRLGRWARRNPAPAAAALLTGVLAVAGPAAAIVINSQRSLLASRVDEIQRLVKDNEKKLDERADTISTLTEELNALTGNSPNDPSAHTDFRTFMIGNLVKARYDQVSNTLSGESVSAEAKARGHLGLAYLFNEMNERDKAQDQLRMAVAALENLHRNSPGNLTWSAGLGDCYQLLASIGKELGDDAVEQHKANALAVRQQVARESNTIEHKLELLDAKLMTVKPEDKNEVVMHWKRLPADFSNNWPTDPNALYELACYLTHRQPTLLDDKPLHDKPRGVRAPSD